MVGGGGGGCYGMTVDKIVVGSVSQPSFSSFVETFCCSQYQLPEYGVCQNKVSRRRGLE